MWSKLIKLLKVSAFLVGIFAISACSGLFPTAQPVEQDEPGAIGGDTVAETVQPATDLEEEDQMRATETQAINSTNTPVLEPTSTLPPTSEAVPTMEEEEPSVSEPTASVRQHLVATNPATVQLASGNVQLVEFFAFW